MSARLRSILVLAAAGLGLSACSYYGGYGYGGLSVGYGAGYCDPYYYDCYRGYGGYGGYYDPWYGWYGDYYYPGIGIYVFDRSGRRHRWNDDHRRYWEGRRGRWQGRDWNDRRWERWDNFRGDRDGARDGDRSGWRDRSQRQDWNENQGSFRRDGIRQQSTEPESAARPGSAPRAAGSAPRAAARAANGAAERRRGERPRRAGAGGAGEAIPKWQAGRRRISTIEVKRITGTPSWLVTVVWVRNEPRSGLERDGVLSRILPVTVSVSPG